jgi:tripartite-type tricarboxylate transporter receptor subunit TctC
MRPQTAKFLLLTARAVVPAAALLIVAAGTALAQGYPVKPIRIAMPFSTGGTDLVTRWLALKLAPVLGQQIVPEPRTGAGGNIAFELVAKAPPDGYTLLMAPPPFVVNTTLYAKVPYDPFRDFAPVILCAAVPTVLVSHPSVPAKNLRELVQLARANPNKLSYASGGIGSTPHLSGELLKSLTKTSIVHVPYKGGALGLVGAMSGEVDIVFTTMSAAVASYVNSGKMRGMAILDHKRVISIPQVPTSAEAGLPQLVAVNWYVLLAPAGTPRDIIDRLNAETTKVMQTPETRERLLAVGGEPATSTPEQAAEFLRTEFTRWSKVIKDAGIRAE